jgi:hypothetical protein
MTDYRMDDAPLRLERIHVTLRYIQLWRRYMSDEELEKHIARAYEDTGNARQVAKYWKEFAEMNGVELEPQPRHHIKPLIIIWPLALGRWLAKRLRRDR